MTVTRSSQRTGLTAGTLALVLVAVAAIQAAVALPAETRLTDVTATSALSYDPTTGTLERLSDTFIAEALGRATRSTTTVEGESATVSPATQRDPVPQRLGRDRPMSPPRPQPQPAPRPSHGR